MGVTAVVTAGSCIGWSGCDPSRKQRVHSCPVPGGRSSLAPSTCGPHGALLLGIPSPSRLVLLGSPLHAGPASRLTLALPALGSHDACPSPSCLPAAPFLSSTIQTESRQLKSSKGTHGTYTGTLPLPCSLPSSLHSPLPTQTSPLLGHPHPNLSTCVYAWSGLAQLSARGPPPAVP